MIYTDFTVCKANEEQRNYVLQRISKTDDFECKNGIIYVAVSNDGKIIGRIIALERDVPEPIKGKRWYIDNIFVDADYRRKGIATALVDEIIREATSLDVVYLYGSANPSKEATMFWMNQGFTLNAYGRKQEDESNPLFLGNYYHMISYCLRRKKINKRSFDENIRELTQSEVLNIINEYVENEKKRNAYLSKANEIYGYGAIGNDGEIKGFILSFVDSMQPPLENKRRFIFPYVKPKHRKQGIGTALVYKMYEYARSENTMQLTAFDDNDSNIGFYHKIGFDIFFWDINRQTGKRATTAMLRV